MRKDTADAKPHSCRYLRLQTKLSIAISSLVIITAALLTCALFMTARHQLREDIRCRLRNIAAIAALQIDSTAHATLRDRSQETSDTYLRLKGILQKMHNKIPDIRYIYTWRFNDAGELVFVVDAETDPKKISHIGDIYHCDDEKELQTKLADIKGPIADEILTPTNGEYGFPAMLPSTVRTAAEKAYWGSILPPRML